MTVPDATNPEATGSVTAAVLGPLIAGDPHRPRLIWHGNGRTELSTATLANWAAKTAGYLIDELGARPGSLVQWRVQRSWQAAPLLLGAWWAGMVVTDLESAPDAVAAFVDEGEDSEADEVIVASSHPFGLATTAVQPHQRHVADAILQQADRFSPRRPLPLSSSPVAVTAGGSNSVQDLLTAATAAAARIGPGGRVLSVVDLTLPGAVATALLGTLAADGSLIQVTGSATGDPGQLAKIAADEGATVTFGCDVAGLPRLD